MSKKNNQFIAKHTEAEGDCAYHAIFGDWDSTKGRYVCSDVKDKREETSKTIHQAIERKTERDTRILQLSKIAIQESIMAAVDEYALYVISEFDDKSCMEIKGNAVILTDRNLVYFIIKGQIVLRNKLAYAVDNIDRCGITIEKDSKLMRLIASSEITRTIIKQSVLKAKDELTRFVQESPLIIYKKTYLLFLQYFEFVSHSGELLAKKWSIFEEKLREHQNIHYDLFLISKVDSNPYEEIKGNAVILTNDNTAYFIINGREQKCVKNVDRQKMNLCESDQLTKAEITQESRDLIQQLILREGYAQTILDYVDSHHRLESGKSLKDKLYDALNVRNGELRQLIYSIPALNEAFEIFSMEKEFLWPELITGAVIAEYAECVNTMGRWSLPAELALLAEIFNITVEYYTAQTYLLEADIYNPGQSKRVAVQFNGINHYEQMVEEVTVSQLQDEECYELFLIEKFDLKECQKIKGNAIVLTDDNIAYFIVNGKISLDEDKPKIISDVNRQGIAVCASPQPIKIDRQNKKEAINKIMVELALKKLSSSAELDQYIAAYPKNYPCLRYVFQSYQKCHFTTQFATLLDIHNKLNGQYPTYFIAEDPLSIEDEKIFMFGVVFKNQLFIWHPAGEVINRSFFDILGKICVMSKSGLAIFLSSNSSKMKHRINKERTSVLALELMKHYSRFSFSFDLHSEEHSKSLTDFSEFRYRIFNLVDLQEVEKFSPSILNLLEYPPEKFVDLPIEWHQKTIDKEQQIFEKLLNSREWDRALYKELAESLEILAYQHSMPTEMTENLLSGFLNGYDYFFNPRYVLYLISELDLQECSKIKENAIILTDKNIAYIIAGGKLVNVNETFPFSIKNIHRNEIPKSHSTKLLKYTDSEKLESKIFAQCGVEKPLSTVLDIDFQKIINTMTSEDVSSEQREMVGNLISSEINDRFLKQWLVHYRHGIGKKLTDEQILTGIFPASMRNKQLIQLLKEYNLAESNWKSILSKPQRKLRLSDKKIEYPEEILIDYVKNIISLEQEKIKNIEKKGESEKRKQDLLAKQSEDLTRAYQDLISEGVSYQKAGRKLDRYCRNIETQKAFLEGIRATGKKSEVPIAIAYAWAEVQESALVIWRRSESSDRLQAMHYYSELEPPSRLFNIYYTENSGYQSLVSVNISKRDTSIIPITVNQYKAQKEKKKSEWYEKFFYCVMAAMNFGIKDKKYIHLFSVLLGPLTRQCKIDDEQWNDYQNNFGKSREDHQESLWKDAYQMLLFIEERPKRENTLKFMKDEFKKKEFMWKAQYECKLYFIINSDALVTRPPLEFPCYVLTQAPLQLQYIVHDNPIAEDCDLYLIDKFNIEQVNEIKGNAIILTNKNTVYFVINGKIAMREGKPHVVEGIKRQGVAKSKSQKLIKYSDSAQIKNNIIKYALRGGYYTPIDLEIGSAQSDILNSLLEKFLFGKSQSLAGVVDLSKESNFSTWIEAITSEIKPDSRLSKDEKDRYQQIRQKLQKESKMIEHIADIILLTHQRFETCQSDTGRPAFLKEELEEEKYWKYCEENWLATIQENHPKALINQTNYPTPEEKDKLIKAIRDHLLAAIEKQISDSIRPRLMRKAVEAAKNYSLEMSLIEDNYITPILQQFKGFLERTVDFIMSGEGFQRFREDGRVAFLIRKLGDQIDQKPWKNNKLLSPPTLQQEVKNFQKEQQFYWAQHIGQEQVECNLYLMEELPTLLKLQEYKNSYIFLYVERKIKLFFVNYEGKAELIGEVDIKESQTLLKNVENLGIDHQLPLKSQVSKQILDKFWDILTSFGYIRQLLSYSQSKALPGSITRFKPMESKIIQQYKSQSESWIKEHREILKKTELFMEEELDSLVKDILGLHPYTEYVDPQTGNTLCHHLFLEYQKLIHTKSRPSAACLDNLMEMIKLTHQQAIHGYIKNYKPDSKTAYELAELNLNLAILESDQAGECLLPHIELVRLGFSSIIASTELAYITKMTMINYCSHTIEQLRSMWKRLVTNVRTKQSRVIILFELQDALYKLSAFTSDDKELIEQIKNKILLNPEWKEHTSLLGHWFGSSKLKEVAALLVTAAETQALVVVDNRPVSPGALRHPATATAVQVKRLQNNVQLLQKKVQDVEKKEAALPTEVEALITKRMEDFREKWEKAQEEKERKKEAMKKQQDVRRTPEKRPIYGSSYSTNRYLLAGTQNSSSNASSESEAELDGQLTLPRSYSNFV